MYRVLKLKESAEDFPYATVKDVNGTVFDVYKRNGKFYDGNNQELTPEEVKRFKLEEDSDVDDLENPDEIKPEEDLEDKISDEIPDEEYMVDPILNELRDVLVDLDWNLFMIGNDDIGPLYIIGRLNDEGIEEMLVEDGESFKFIELPDRIENIMNYNTVYGKPEDEDSRDEAGEDVEIAPEDNLAKGVPHEEIMEFLMNKLVEINPEAAEELKKDKPEEDELPLPEPENNEEGDEE